jgi:hypothetical protein
MSDFLQDDESFADLVGRMPEEDQGKYRKYGHLRIESAFVGRVLIVYQPTGLNAMKQHREPRVLSTLRVTDFVCDANAGSSAKIVDQETGALMAVNHIPRRVFDYELYMSVPPRMHLRWDARAMVGGTVRSLSFALLVKARNRSDFYSLGNTYAETPNVFLKLYPNANGAGRFLFS